MNSTSNLTASEERVQQISSQLTAEIARAIAEAGGKISFYEFMKRCLYTPGLGYYSNGSHKLGQGGDFVTAPELSCLFSRTIARQAIPILQQLSDPNLLEFGAGSGKMAATILTELDHSNCLPNNYFILETSADLRDRQLTTFKAEIPHLLHLVKWLNVLPDPFTGLILANEVCDAMPVNRLLFNSCRISEYFVTFANGDFSWCSNEIHDPRLKRRSEEIKQIIGEADVPYETEVNLTAEAWVSSIAATLKQGAVLIIDYGYPRTTYYHPQRKKGSLMCYYQHQGHDNPFVHIGLQDITAHIDFTALAEAAVESGLNVAGYLTQADFLLAGGITDIAMSDERAENIDKIQYATEIKRLTLPGEMGESFKALLLCTDSIQISKELQQADRRHKL